MRDIVRRSGTFVSGISEEHGAARVRGDVGRSGRLADHGLVADDAAGICFIQRVGAVSSRKQI